MRTRAGVKTQTGRMWRLAEAAGGAGLPGLAPLMGGMLLALCACGPAVASVRPEDQGLRIVCSVDDALVFVDDVLVGTAVHLRGRDLPVLPGRHRVEVRANSYFPRYEEVEVPPRSRVQLEVTLRQRPTVP